MNILQQKISCIITRSLTTVSVTSISRYLHYKDHNEKINPKDTRLSLSFMDPKVIPQNVPALPKHNTKLKKGAQNHMQKLLFQNYKDKILGGAVDQEVVVEPDTLWGDHEKPVHYYKRLSMAQLAEMSHSIKKDVQVYYQELINDFIHSVKKIEDVSQVKDINDLADLAVNYKKNGETNRQKYYEIQKLINNKYHKLSNRSLVLFKYAYCTSPKKCTPEFNKIINHLLIQSIQKLSLEQLVHLMYFARFDHYRYFPDNLQIPVVQQISKHFHEMSEQQKIDFLFLFVQSRRPTIRPRSHDRHYNQPRNKFQQLMLYLNINDNLSQLPQKSVLKLTYCLVKAKTNATGYYTISICDYLQKNMQKISNKNLILFFIYLGRIEANRSVANIDLMKNMREKITSSWEQHSKIDKLRALDAMFTLNMYGQAQHQLYTAIPIQADSTELAYFCRLQIMTSSSREWEIIHRFVELSHAPLFHFQDYKRFYNYVRATAPDWDLKAFKNKLQNTQSTYDTLRQKTFAMDKRFFRQLSDFKEFSFIKDLPHSFRAGQPIQNIEFVDFALPEYQITIDVITDVERVGNTKDVKGSFLRKVKSLQCLGWKHLYVFEQDIQALPPLQMFDYLYSICQPHFEEQLQVIAAFQEQRFLQVQKLKGQYVLSALHGVHLESLLTYGDFRLADEEQAKRNVPKQGDQAVIKEQDLDQDQFQQGQP